MLFESELEKLLRSFRILDPNTRLTARDVAVAQAIHLFVAGAANRLLKGSSYKAFRPAGTAQADVDKNGGLRSRASSAASTPFTSSSVALPQPRYPQLKIVVIDMES